MRRRLASLKSLAKSLAESLTKSLAETLSETLGKTFGETFRTRQASPQSLGSDYMHGSPQDSLRDSFFYAGSVPPGALWVFEVADDENLLKILNSKWRIYYGGLICKNLLYSDENWYYAAIMNSCVDGTQFWQRIRKEHTLK